MLDRAETLLVASEDRMSLALLFCDRAEIEMLSQRTQAATDSVANATRIADELACGADSELRRRLAALALPNAVTH